MAWRSCVEWARRRWRGHHPLNAASRALFASLAATSNTPEQTTRLCIEQVRMRLLGDEIKCGVSTLALFRIWKIPWEFPNFDSLGWQRDILWASRRWRGNHLLNAASRALLASIIYNIWRERNSRRFTAIAASAEAVAYRAMEEVTDEDDGTIDAGDDGLHGDLVMTEEMGSVALPEEMTGVAVEMFDFDGLGGDEEDHDASWASLRELQARWVEKFGETDLPTPRALGGRLRPVASRQSTPFPRRVLRNPTADDRRNFLATLAPPSRVCAEDDGTMETVAHTAIEDSPLMMDPSPTAREGSPMPSPLRYTSPPMMERQNSPSLCAVPMLNPEAPLETTMHTSAASLPGLFIGKVPITAPSMNFGDKIANEFNNSSRKTLSYIPPVIQNDEIVVHPALATSRDGARRWASTAVGYFLGRKPYVHHLNEYVQSVWPAVLEVTATTHGFFFFRVKMVAAMEEVIEGGPWLFQGQAIVLQRWEPGIALRHRTKECPTTQWILKPTVQVYVQRKPQECTDPPKVNTSIPTVSIETPAPAIPRDSPKERPSAEGAKGKEVVVFNPFDALTLVDDDGAESSSKGPKQSSPLASNRIWIAWDSDYLHVDILDMSTQFVHCLIFIRQLHVSVALTIAYGANDRTIRRDLWQSLISLADTMDDDPWLVGGDFNVVFYDSEVCGLAGDTHLAMEEFWDCIMTTGLVTLLMQGELFTWHNCSTDSRSLWKRLDRILSNDRWLERWPNSYYLSLTPWTLDHPPLVIRGDHTPLPAGMFWFDNYLAQATGFLDTVQNIWRHNIVATTMFSVTRKLKALKPVFRQQRRSKGIPLEMPQSLNKPCYNRGQKYSGSKGATNVPGYSFVKLPLDGPQREFFKFRRKEPNTDRSSRGGDTEALLKTVIASEVKQTFFDVEEDKAPGPDGYSAGFYKAAWPIIGEEVTRAILEFFNTGKLLKQVITKIIVQRLSLVLDRLISPSQNAFVPGRSIGDNILLTQELFRGYNQQRLPPRCALKVDLRKASDSVEWDFLLVVLDLFGFLCQIYSVDRGVCHDFIILSLLERYPSWLFLRSPGTPAKGPHFPISLRARYGGFTLDTGTDD
ncbi:UNVERIFIED_CONTAM: hypothetical protein Slati_2448900 [Sesamum latifolium]|uniref:DUF4283 domain-containing protein n=1 Tax=Sesamum latifolium TaxID=2727402 RepID=A0AAW2WD53_9LAMI